MHWDLHFMTLLEVSLRCVNMAASLRLGRSEGLDTPKMINELDIVGWNQQNLMWMQILNVNFGKCPSDKSM